MAPHLTDGQRGAAVSAPSVPRWEVADLFRLYGEAYRRDHLVPPSQQKVRRAIEACRTAPLGGHAAHGPTCGCERYAYTSCRNRHGPKCQTLTKGQGLEDRKTERWPVPYCHTVFTLPHALNLVVLNNTRTLLTLVFKAARETLRQCGRRNLGGQLGCTLVLHPWAQTLGAHCHVHCVMPAGALALDGERWSAAAPRFLLPVRALSRVLRGTCLEALTQACTKGAFPFTGTIAALGTPQGFATLHEPLRSKDWVVSTKKPCGGPAQGLDDVSRSTHRVALANTRSSEGGDGWGRCTSRHRHQGDRVQSMTLDAQEFLRRFLLHIVPSGWMRIRHGGCLANRWKAHALRQCRQLLGQSPDPPPRALRSVAEWLRPLPGIDLTQCPHCGYGPLVRSPLPSLTGLSPHGGTSQEVPPCDSS